MSARTYTKRPGSVEALQYTGAQPNTADLFDWTDGDFQPGNGSAEMPPRLWVAANKSWLPLEEGEWVAKDSLGFYPIKDAVFRTSYEVD